MEIAPQADERTNMAIEVLFCVCVVFETWLRLAFHEASVIPKWSRSCDEQKS